MKNESEEVVTFWNYMNKAEKSGEVLNDIPVAEMQPISAVEYSGSAYKPIENPKQIMAIVVKGKIVASVSKRYKLVQHKEAFDPIFKGLHKTGTDYDFAMFRTDTKAFLRVFTTGIKDNGSSIQLGFEARNSIDGRNAITYNLGSKLIERKTEIVARSVQVVDVWGYRQVCSNGMKIRVPLVQHEEIHLFKETTEKIRELLAMATRIVHLGEAEQKIKAVQYVVEAMALLKEPVALIIEKAKDRKIGQAQAKKLIALYIGKRLAKDIQEKFATEDKTLWGLYNAVTFVASHGVAIPTMNGLINKSAILLEKEVFEKPLKVKA
jgi:hypothetical protein